MFSKKRFYEALAGRSMPVTRLATTLEMNQATLFRKIKGESDFTRAEIQEIRERLSLSQAEMDAIFFAKKLAETRESVAP